MTTDSPCLAHVKDFWTRVLQDKGHGVQHDAAIKGLVLESATPSKLVARLPIESHHLNGHGTVHGGIIMSLTDIVTWLGLQAEGVPGVVTVSANMSAEFVRPGGRVGDQLYCVATKVQRGRRLAFSRIEFFVNDLNSKTCAYGNHSQALVQPPAFTATFSADGMTATPVVGAGDKAKL